MPLKGGERLASFFFNAEHDLNNAQGLQLGFFPKSVYPDGTPVAYVVAVNEFGYAPHNIPSRPAFRTMIANKSHEWPADLAAALKANNYDAHKALDFVGFKMEDQLRDSIKNGGWVPNAPATIAHKGSAVPLIDTLLMINSVMHEII
jgi:hypothetical protein